MKLQGLISISVRMADLCEEDKQRAENAPHGVIITNNIRGNGRKKILIIGKTGTGKSSLCNVITGHQFDAEIFQVSSGALSCTQKTQGSFS